MNEAEVEGGAEAEELLRRLAFFSDGVFAIAMTLLVVQFTVPAIPNGLSQAETGHQLASGLAALKPAYLSFALSFLVIARFWVTSHRRFQHLRRFDGGLLWLNLLLLLAVVFIPFPTAVLGRYIDQPVAAVFYAVTLAAAGVVSVAIMPYAIWRGLADPALDLRQQRRSTLRAATMPVVFLASVPLAQVNTSAAEYSWLAVLVLNLALRRF
jgi:uncharacterized membrane protein